MEGFFESEIFLEGDIFDRDSFFLRRYSGMDGRYSIGFFWAFWEMIASLVTSFWSQHNHLLTDYLCLIFFLTWLIFPRSCLYTALEIDFVSFSEILFCDFCELPKKRDIVIFRDILLYPSTISIATIGRDREIGNALTAWQCSHFWIGCHISDELCSIEGIHNYRTKK